MDLEYILNDALNKALSSKSRIKQPNSNNVASFVNEYLETFDCTFCCTDFKKKKQVPFDEWLRTKGYKTDFVGNWIKGERVIRASEIVLKEYEYSKNL